MNLINVTERFKTDDVIESAFSLFRCGIIGSFHQVSIKNLHCYLSEFETRFNGRKEKDHFESVLRQMLGKDAMPYLELVAE